MRNRARSPKTFHDHFRGQVRRRFSRKLRYWLAALRVINSPPRHLLRTSTALAVVNTRCFNRASGATALQNSLSTRPGHVTNLCSPKTGRATPQTPSPGPDIIVQVQQLKTTANPRVRKVRFDLLFVAFDQVGTRRRLSRIPCSLSSTPVATWLNRGKFS